jgi:GNAT superfamily N-acetyltransferase
VCDAIAPWEHGTAVRCTALPDFWSYNSLRVEGPQPELTGEALASAADRLQGDLGHRQVEVEDEAAGERLRPAVTALGWTTERLVWMRLDGPPPDGPDFEQVPFGATRELRLAWTRTASWATGEQTALRFSELEEAVAHIRGSRALLARNAAGEPAGFAIFQARGRGAEVEQAYVMPELRGQGTGGALVAAAARAAGAQQTFIVADDEGDPKRLYLRLGFRPVWLQHVFTRRPG